MKIKENPALGLDAEELKAWPFWTYGWYGTDGIDWRARATDRGLAGIDGIAEEATPLAPEQAAKWDLYLAFEHLRFLDDGSAEYAVRAHKHVTVGEMVEAAIERYGRQEKHITVGRSARIYADVREIPEPLRDLMAVSASLRLDGPGTPFRIHVDT